MHSHQIMPSENTQQLGNNNANINIHFIDSLISAFDKADLINVIQLLRSTDGITLTSNPAFLTEKYHGIHLGMSMLGLWKNYIFTNETVEINRYKIVRFIADNYCLDKNGFKFCIKAFSEIGDKILEYYFFSFEMLKLAKACHSQIVRLKLNFNQTDFNVYFPQPWQDGLESFNAKITALSELDPRSSIDDVRQYIDNKFYQLDPIIKRRMLFENNVIKQFLIIKTLIFDLYFWTEQTFIFGKKIYLTDGTVLKVPRGIFEIFLFLAEMEKTELTFPVCYDALIQLQHIVRNILTRISKEIYHFRQEHTGIIYKKISIIDVDNNVFIRFDDISAQPNNYFALVDLAKTKLQGLKDIAAITLFRGDDSARATQSSNRATGA